MAMKLPISQDRKWPGLGLGLAEQSRDGAKGHQRAGRSRQWKNRAKWLGMAKFRISGTQRRSGRMTAAQARSESICCQSQNRNGSPPASDNHGNTPCTMRASNSNNTPVQPNASRKKRNPARGNHKLVTSDPKQIGQDGTRKSSHPQNNVDAASKQNASASIRSWKRCLARARWFLSCSSKRSPFLPRNRPNCARLDSYENSIMKNCLFQDIIKPLMLHSTTDDSKDVKMHL